jgi:hypothetical protein
MFEERRAASVETLPALIGKRQSTISYIKRCLQGAASRRGRRSRRRRARRSGVWSTRSLTVRGAQARRTG